MKTKSQIENTITSGITSRGQRTFDKGPVSLAICTLLLLLLPVAGALAQTVLAKIPIPSSSNGELATNPALSLVYSASGLLSGGTLTIVDGHTLSVVTTISNSGGALNGIAVDLMNDNFWTTNLFGGQILTYSSANTEIFANSVGYCPDGTSFDCKRRRIWPARNAGAETIRFLSSMRTHSP